MPKFFAIQGDEVDEREWIAQPCDRAKRRIYAVGTAGSMWSSSGLGAALAEEGRACLVLCGFWLERSVTFAALNALADGFDVFVLMDACPSCDRHAKCPAIDRLLQAGGVPLTTAQMVSEWAHASGARSTSALNAAVCTLKIARCRKGRLSGSKRRRTIASPPHDPLQDARPVYRDCDCRNRRVLSSVPLAEEAGPALAAADCGSEPCSVRLALDPAPY
ncbi:MAG: isochorismatase family protein [Hyphomicrobium sp.]|nr:MAG: isochorismatase family protein [Hyphomicrobium sp.]